VDIVEEDFHQETIPFVRGADRRTLVGRKLAQRYRDTSLSLAISLGFEKTQRRDERLLLSSFTNNAQFQPWLNVLRERRQSRAFSVALVAPRLALIGRRRCLLVTLRQAGLRKTSSRRKDPLQPPRRRGMPSIRAGSPKRSIARRRASTST
jgi:hypothetical protein